MMNYLSNVFAFSRYFGYKVHSTQTQVQVRAGMVHMYLGSNIDQPSIMVRSSHLHPQRYANGVVATALNSQFQVAEPLAGNVGDMSATCRVSRHMLRVSGRHPKCCDILDRLSVFRRCHVVVFVSSRAWCCA